MSSTCITTQPRESSQATNSKLPGLFCLLALNSMPVRQGVHGSDLLPGEPAFRPPGCGQRPAGAPPTAGKPAAHIPWAGQGPQGWAVSALSLIHNLCSKSLHLGCLRLFRPLLRSEGPIVQFCFIFIFHSIIPQAPSGTSNPTTCLLQST